ncbi:MAG: hypothetical protein AAF550_01320, partial [Myxococcota bacterium]
MPTQEDVLLIPGENGGGLEPLQAATPHKTYRTDGLEKKRMALNVKGTRTARLLHVTGFLRVRSISLFAETRYGGFALD